METGTAKGPEQGLRILLVEDVASNWKLLRRLLERHGLTSVDAEHGQIALDIYDSGPDSFDSILIDFEKPVLDGPSAVEELRRRGGDLVIVGVTGRMLAEDVEYCCKCGANAVTPKPLRWDSSEDV